MQNLEQLRITLKHIDRRGYKAYKQIVGSYQQDDFSLYIDHVQGDPFAAPSKIRISIEQDLAQIPKELFCNYVRQMALEDFLARHIKKQIFSSYRGRNGSGKSGQIEIDAGRQEIIKRSAVVVRDEFVEARLEVGLPARGRNILGYEAANILCEMLPSLARSSFYWKDLPQKKLEEFVLCAENQEYLRKHLQENKLVAFIADGSLLPRESGASDKPLPDGIPFKSPESLRITLNLPNPIKGNEQEISGMGVPPGVTLIVGGGYHGKSTLLKALERSVYPHIPEDGREYVITAPSAVKIRAEDGRAVSGVDISSFVSDIPYGQSTSSFSTSDASGSTSQAANIIEAFEAGSDLLLIDEDTSASNFMIRDARMQQLVAVENEPITPFIDRVKELYENYQISTILVAGSSGDFFDVADTVIMMKNYLPIDATKQALDISKKIPVSRASEANHRFQSVVQRIPLANSFDPCKGRHGRKVDAKGSSTILFGKEPIDLKGLEQIVDQSQTRAIAYSVLYASEELMKKNLTLREILNILEQKMDLDDLDWLDPFYRPEEHPGNLARPRRYEIAAAMNRYRPLKVKQL